MFTGIVQAVGRIAAVEARGDGLRVAVDIGIPDVADVTVGDSIAINGCCLTVVEINGSTLDFDVSAETLRCTTGLDRVGDVNVELALRLADRLGGHLMTGHVDGVGTVTRFAAVAGDPYGSWELEVEAPEWLAHFVAAKGSIAVQGVSLQISSPSMPATISASIFASSKRRSSKPSGGWAAMRDSWWVAKQRGGWCRWAAAR